MKTIEELYQEILANEELKKEFLSLKSEELEAFAAKNGCEASLDEIKSFFESKKNQTGELSDEELDQIVGGKEDSLFETLLSVCSGGIGCVIDLVVSLAVGEVGTAIKGEGMICAEEGQ